MNAREELIECLMKVKLPFSPARAELLLLGECEHLADVILPKLPELGFVRLADGLTCPRCGRIFHDEDVKKSPDDYFTCPTCSTIQHKKCMGLIGEVYVRLEDVEIDIIEAKRTMNDICIECVRKKNLCIPQTCSCLANGLFKAKGILRVKEGK